MVFNVRCFKCGEQAVRLVMGGRSIIHARCHACESNLLAEVMEFERQVEAESRADNVPKPESVSDDPGSTQSLDAAPADGVGEETVQPEASASSR